MAPFTACIILVIYGCTHNTYTATNHSYKHQAKAFAKELSKQPEAIDSTPAPPYWVGTTNFGMRKPNFVIIHHTAQNACDSTLRTFTLTRTQVSAHYVICKDGTIHHMLSDYLRAWHAGVGKWGNVTDVNSISIGIELDNNGFEPFSAVQINSLLHLLKQLKKNYGIPRLFTPQYDKHYETIKSNHIFHSKNSRHVKNRCSFIYFPTPQYQHVLPIQN